MWRESIFWLLSPLNLYIPHRLYIRFYVLLDMKPYVDKIRFRTFRPKGVNSAVTNGIFVRFGNVELSHDEILSMAEREHLNGR